MSDEEEGSVVLVKFTNFDDEEQAQLFVDTFKENKKSIVINTKNDIRSVGINHELYLKPSNLYMNYLTKMTIIAILAIDLVI